MGATITYLPEGKTLGHTDHPRVPSFEEALKEVEQAHRQLLMDRLAAKARLAEAVRAVEELEEQAQNRLNAALLQFHFAGGERLELAEFDWAVELAAQLDRVVTSVSDALRIEWTA